MVESRVAQNLRCCCESLPPTVSLHDAGGRGSCCKVGHCCTVEEIFCHLEAEIGDVQVVATVDTRVVSA